MDYLLWNKAKAIADLTQKQFPHLNVDTRPVDARETRELLEADIVVDATGEEAFSTYLNEKVIERRLGGKKAPVVVYTWIAGAGVAVQSLLVDSQKTGCYRCLRVESSDGELGERYSAVKKGPSRMLRVGCESYMPFPVSTSVQAAALAADVLLDWARGHGSPRFRTKLIDFDLGQKVKDQDPEPLPSCRACRNR